MSTKIVTAKLIAKRDTGPLNCQGCLYRIHINGKPVRGTDGLVFLPMNWGGKKPTARKAASFYSFALEIIKQDLPCRKH